MGWPAILSFAEAAHFRPPEATVLSQGAPGKEARAELSLCLCPPSSPHQRGEVPFVTLSFPFLSHAAPVNSSILFGNINPKLLLP